MPASEYRTFLRTSLTWTIGALAVVGCKDAKRCWDDASCVQAQGELEGSDAAPSATEDGGATETEFDASEPTEGGGITSEPSGSTTPSSDTVSSGGEGTLPAASSAATASSDGSASQVQAHDTSGWASTETLNDSTNETDATSEEPPCSSDDQCGTLLCVAGACEVCDPSDHRGCETSETGNRCRSAEDGNTCVACVTGDTAPASSETCGINARGVQVLECVTGVWQTTSCDDPDECQDGGSQVGTTPCGPNGEGRYLVRCNAGSWEDDTASCIDDDQCVNDTRRVSDIECGFSGYLEQQCVSGTWLTQSNRCLECSRKYRVPDPRFQTWLSDRNGIEADPVDPNSVRYLTSLDLSFGSIEDATGIECFTSLQDLNLAKNQLTDVTPLASLTNLRSLNLAYNLLANASLAPLGALKELTTLSLDITGVSSLVGLESVTALENLRLEYNYIIDVAPLLPLTSLQSLDLLGNAELDCSSNAYNTLKSRVPEFISSCP